MADFDDLQLPDNGFETRGSRQLLWDVWFVLRSKTGLGKLLNAIADRVGSRQIPVYDENGKAVGSTSKDNEASWNRANFKRQSDKIDALQKQVDALNSNLSVAVNGAVATALKNVQVTATADNAAIAQAVAAELAARLKGA